MNNLFVNKKINLKRIRTLLNKLLKTDFKRYSKFIHVELYNNRELVVHIGGKNSSRDIIIFHERHDGTDKVNTFIRPQSHMHFCRWLARFIVNAIALEFNALHGDEFNKEELNKPTKRYAKTPFIKKIKKNYKGFNETIEDLRLHRNFTIKLEIQQLSEEVSQ